MTIEDLLRPDDWLHGGSGPRYLKLRRRLEAAIAGGHLSPDFPLPPEREIARQTGLSRVTVRRAIGDLVSDGKVEPRQGSGSFVRSEQQNDTIAVSRLASFENELAERGTNSSSQVLEVGRHSPSPDEIAALGIAPTLEVIRLSRLRTSDGRPIAIEEAVLPCGLLPKPKKLKGSLYVALADAGSPPVRAIQRITATALSKKQARLLKATKGEPALCIERTVYLGGGRAVVRSRTHFLAGCYEVIAELRPSRPGKGG